MVLVAAFGVFELDREEAREGANEREVGVRSVMSEERKEREDYIFFRVYNIYLCYTLTYIQQILVWHLDRFANEDEKKAKL